MMAWLQVLASLGLLALDYLWRSLRWLFKSVRPWMPPLVRVSMTGALAGGVVVGILAVSVRLAPLFPTGWTWPTVAALWGCAVVLLSMFGLAFLVIQTGQRMLVALLTKMTDVARPALTASEPPRFRPYDPLASPGSVRQPVPKEPKFRPPEAGGEFMGTSEEGSFLLEYADQLRANGVSEDNIAELVEEARSERVE